jgi:hypothetical protein
MTALTACPCCGEERAEAELVRLGCHDEVALCDRCVAAREGIDHWRSEELDDCC